YRYKLRTRSVPLSNTSPNASQRPHSRLPLPLVGGRPLGLDLSVQGPMSPSSSSASAGSSHAGLAIVATAMALSGTLVLFSLCRAKQTHLQVPSSDADAAGAPSPRLRPCLSSSEKRKKREKARRGSKKRVRFAADVVDNGAAASSPRAAARKEEAEPSCAAAAAAMPANREALYRGMLRGRSMLRLACSY
ncbi:unnamed protein product, partial [Urochloa humidicola]